MAAEAVRQKHLSMPWWLVLLEGIAAIVLGLLLLTAPQATLVVLVQLMGIYWLIKGILQIISIFIDSSGWGWKLPGEEIWESHYLRPTDPNDDHVVGLLVICLKLRA